MLHLRVITPPELTESVLDLYRHRRGIANVVAHRGAAIDPQGDVVAADVARDAADGLIGGLRALGIDQDGAITMEVLDTVLSTAAYRAEDEIHGDGEDAVIWDELVLRTRGESGLSFSYLAFLTIACLLASIGVLTDSPITVVGAMVVGPEFGPLAALAVAVVRRKGYLAKRAVLALLIGFPVAMAITALATKAFQALGWVRLSSIHELQQMDFIFQVGPFSFVVALLAGAAGMLSMVTSKSAALVGVFISVTTVPAAGMTVVAAITRDWDVALGSAGQLAVNMVGITAAAVLLLAGYNRTRRRVPR
ncbi:hypothetical protein BOO86_02380 [Mycobacterium sp. CBMA 234]|uniref:DUF389 domain-containing protein n=1 Tax=Mycolicibacterium sp. CBMA 234 TaxID=1918495 RepID=UPI001390A7AF|nr:DUF389 domain-containing protein [Mycolicibacterium sp. CBMA 234]MUL63300.1 hypothetical protein [Mycolicibacterium sp. CBMA 234]